jgi:hypothetical protein
LPSKWFGVVLALAILVGITALIQLGLDIPEDILEVILLAILGVLGFSG